MTCHEANDVAVLTPQGHLHEGEESDRLEADLALLLARSARRIVVDLGAAGHLSARALGIIAHAHQEARQRGGRLEVAGLNREQRRLFDITGLAGVLELGGDAIDAPKTGARRVPDPALSPPPPAAAPRRESSARA